jgi:hypothetical protein
LLLLSCSSYVCDDRLFVRKRNLTITEVAELTGLSRKAIARRVERGSVGSVLRSGRRLIPRSELVRVGLLPSEGNSGVAEGNSGVAELTGSVPSTPLAVSQGATAEHSLLEALVRELLDRVQRQAGELAQYRALTAEAQSLRLERELADLRVRLAVLEGGATQRALEPGSPDEGGPVLEAPVEHSETPRFDQSSERRIWLPPTAVAVRAHRPEDMVSGWPTKGTETEFHAPWSRLVPVAAEMLFIGTVAVLAWLADVRVEVAVAAVGVAWMLAATIEFVRWRR